MVTGTWLRVWHQPTPTGCCLLHEPSFLCPHPWGTPSRRRRLPEPPVGPLGPQNTLTGKAVPEINSGLACPPGLRPGLKVKCTGALQVQQPPSLDSRQATPQGPSAAEGCYLQGPHLHLPLPSRSPSPLVEPRDQMELLGLGLPAPCGQPRQGPQRPSCQANATPLLFTGPQVPVRHLDLQGTGRKKTALKTLPTHHTEQDPLGSLISSGQPHAPSQGRARPGCLEPLEGAPSSVPGPESWCYPEADTDGARMDSGVGGQMLRPQMQQGSVRDPCWVWVGPPCPGSWPLQDKTSPVPQHRRQQGGPSSPS